MLPETYEHFAVTYISAFLCAIAVKLADDYLDQYIDKEAEKTNMASWLGRGLPIYAMLVLSLAIFLNPPVSLALFIACYVIGMVNDFEKTFPSKLRGYQEAIVVVIVGVCLSGWEHMLFALIFTYGIQLADDCIDIKKDSLLGNRNLAYRIGFIEATLLAVICLLASWRLAESLFVPVFCAVLTFYFCDFWLQGVQKNA